MPEAEVTTIAAVEEAPERPRAQVGHLLFLGGFLLLIALVPLAQILLELRQDEPVQVLDVFREVPTTERLTGFERALEDASVIAREVRERWHWFNFAVLRAGNQKAVVGRERSLFYRPSLDAAIAPGFMADPEAEGHPVQAIAAFHDCLQRQGVELVLMIAPNKESVYPEWLSRRYPADAGPPDNGDMAEFLAQMRRRGITVVYPIEALWAGKTGGPMYLRQDTHWTPEGLEIAADELARSLPPIGAPRREFATRPLQVSNHGDLYEMLALHRSLPPPLPPETVTVRQVMDTATGEPIQPDPSSPILLLGDSFTNIYGVAQMGWGDHGGLAEQLSLRLGYPVDVIALNDGGVNTSRGNLARRPEPLEGKRVIIWQFAMRDLVVSNGEWQIIEVGRSLADG